MTTDIDVHELLKTVNLSNTSTTKFKPLRASLASSLSLDTDEIYVIGAASRASNIPIRLVQGKAKDRHHRLGVAVIGTQEVELATQHAKDQAAKGYDAVLVISPDDVGQYAVRSYAVRQGDELEPSLSSLFPSAIAEIVTVAADPEQQPADPAPDGAFVALPIDTLTVEAVHEECRAQNLQFSTELIAQCVTALRADKHLLLTGPPGTGKTSLAEAIARAAERLGVTNGVVMTTATSDWTSVDTVGAYRPTRDNQLRFHPGLVVEAVERQKWAVIDEFNRADIDKAIGQLFTLLSGKTVVLPHEVEFAEGDFRRIALVPEGEPREGGHHNVEVGGEWRLIATMNNTDLDLLYDVSQALKRRFAMIHVEPLPPTELRSVLDGFPTGDDAVDKIVRALAGDPELTFGAALWIDLANFLREHVSVRGELGAAVHPANALGEAACLIFVPQGVSSESVLAAVARAVDQSAADSPPPAGPSQAT